jgi:hypothetical protein
MSTKKKKNWKIGKANGKMGSSLAFGFLKRREYNVELSFSFSPALGWRGRLLRDGFFF